MTLFEDMFDTFLNSDDLLENDLPLTNKRAKGGTIMWRHIHEPSIKRMPFSSSSFATIVFTPPSSSPSIHVTLYLPTAGKDEEFVIEAVKLYDHLTELNRTYPEHSLFIRGDANVNPKDNKRLMILNSILSRFDLKRIDILHNTYHHFMGEGQSDSKLDVLQQLVKN